MKKRKSANGFNEMEKRDRRGRGSQRVRLLCFAVLMFLSFCVVDFFGNGAVEYVDNSLRTIICLCIIYVLDRLYENHIS